MTSPRMVSSVALLAVVLAGVAGYVDLRAEEVQGPALLVLLGAFVVGGAAPRGWWWLGGLVGVGVPVAHAWARLSGLPVSYDPSLPPTLIAVAVACAGAGLGAALVRATGYHDV